MGDNLDSLDAEYDPAVIAAAIDIYGDEYDTPANHGNTPTANRDVRHIREEDEAVKKENGDPTEEAMRPSPTAKRDATAGNADGQKRAITPEEEARRLREQYMRMRLAYTKNNYDKLHRAELERQKRVRDREIAKDPESSDDGRKRPPKVNFECMRRCAIFRAWAL